MEKRFYNSIYKMIKLLYFKEKKNSIKNHRVVKPHLNINSTQYPRASTNS